MKTQSGSLILGLWIADGLYLLGLITVSLVCAASLCSCADSSSGKIKPVAGLELQGLSPNSSGEVSEWQVLATSAEIKYLDFSSDNSGNSEIWFIFSSMRQKKLFKLLVDRGLRLFRVVVDEKVICIFEWDVSTTVGYPGVCIRLHDMKEARRLMRAFGTGGW